MTATATKPTKAQKDAKSALVDEFIALALAKWNIDYLADTSDEGKRDLRVIRAKETVQLAHNVRRLRQMADYGTEATTTEAASWTPEPERASNGGGNGARRAAAPKVSEAKLNYAASLLRDVWGDEEAEELIAGLTRYDRDHIDRMIDNLKTLIPISEGQVRFANSLFGQKFGTKGAPEFAASLEQLTKAEAKTMLDAMQDLPDYTPPAGSGERPARRNAPEVEADGMYRDPATGDIFKVQVAVHGSGKLYAKKLIKLDEPVMKRGKEATHEFVMARGTIMMLKPEWKLTREDAAGWGALYGSCVKCGTVLTDEASIERGIGPKCAESF